jgi:hypothetical protein
MPTRIHFEHSDLQYSDHQLCPVGAAAAVVALASPKRNEGTIESLSSAITIYRQLATLDKDGTAIVASACYHLPENKVTKDETKNQDPISPGCYLLPIPICCQANMKRKYSEMEIEEMEMSDLEKKEKKDGTSSKLDHNGFWQPVRDNNGGKSMAPSAIRQYFVDITGGAYGICDTDAHTYTGR